MAATASAIILKKHVTVARGVVATHSPGSPEVITLVHRLAKAGDGFSSNYLFRAQLRSVHAYGGGFGSSYVGAAPALTLRSWNDSQAIFDGVGAGFAVGSPATGAFDILAEDTFEMIT